MRHAGAWLLGAFLLGADTGAVAPPATEALRMANDAIHRFHLDNGAVGLIKPDSSAPVVAIQIWFGTGSIHEDEFLGAGLSHYVEHMIFKGTPTRKPGDITRELDAVGGRVNAYTTLDRTVFHVVLPADDWEVGLEVLADAVMNASFPKEEYQREQQVILQEMAMNRDNPARELNRLLWQTAYRVHPHRHPVIGYREVFLQTTREDLLAFFARHYTPDNMLVALAGDVDPVGAEDRIRAAFADFTRRARPPVVLPAEPPQRAPRTARQTGDYEVSRVAWGYHTVPLHHPDAVALDVLAQVAGGSNSARLPLAIRDRLQLAHNISAWSFTPQEPGLFGIHATFDPAKEDEVIAAVAAEIESWREGDFSEEEIHRACRRVLVDVLHGLQTMRGQVHDMASGEFYTGDPRFTERYLKWLDAITPADLARVLDQYVHPARQTRVLLTPERPDRTVAAEAAPQLIHEPTRQELPNGVPLIVREDYRVPLVQGTLAFLGGTLSETEAQAGLTRFMADLLPRGTATKTAEEIATWLDDRGAAITPFAGLNSFGLRLSALADDWDDVLALAVDMLLQPAFPANEMDRQRARQLAEIRTQREQPMQVAAQLVRNALYPDHPWRWTPSGLSVSVAGLERSDLQRYLMERAVTGNLAVAVFGAVSPEDAHDRVAKAIAAIPAGERFHDRPTIGPRQLPESVKVREPRAQTIFIQAFPTVHLAADEVPAFDLLRTALSGMSSTLGIEVRDRRGLVYFVGAQHQTGLVPGYFAIFAGTAEDDVDEVQRLVAAELARIAEEGLTVDEWARAQAQRRGDQLTLMQNNDSLAQQAALNELYGLGYRYAFDLSDRLQAVTSAEIQAVAAEWLVPERSVTVQVLPARPDPDSAEYP